MINRINDLLAGFNLSAAIFDMILGNYAPAIFCMLAAAMCLAFRRP